MKISKIKEIIREELNEAWDTVGPSEVENLSIDQFINLAKEKNFNIIKLNKFKKFIEEFSSFKDHKQGMPWDEWLIDWNYWTRADIKEDKGSIKLKKDTPEQDIKKYTDKGFNVELNEDSTTEYEDLPDSELIKYAHQSGIEKNIILDGEGGLVNREEIISLLKNNELNEHHKFTPEEQKTWIIQNLKDAGASKEKLHKINQLNAEKTTELYNKLEAIIYGNIKENLFTQDLSLEIFQNKVREIEKKHNVGRICLVDNNKNNYYIYIYSELIDNIDKKQFYSFRSDLITSIKNEFQLNHKSWKTSTIGFNTVEIIVFGEILPDKSPKSFDTTHIEEENNEKFHINSRNLKQTSKDLDELIKKYEEGDKTVAKNIKQKYKVKKELEQLIGSKLPLDDNDLGEEVDKNQFTNKGIKETYDSVTLLKFKPIDKKIIKQYLINNQITHNFGVDVVEVPPEDAYKIVKTLQNKGIDIKPSFA